MGYAHYWSRPRELPAERFAAWSRDVANVVAVAGVPLRNPCDDTTAIIAPSIVAFNGNEGEGQEPFIIEQHATLGISVDAHGDRLRNEWYFGHNWWSDVCKTSRRPYDIIVVAALALFYHHFPTLCDIMSDGTVADWNEGIALAEQVTGFHLYAPNYSHGFECQKPLSREKFATWSADVARVIRTTDVPLAGPDGRGEPIVTPYGVEFNGMGDGGHEPFRLIGESVQWPDYADHLWLPRQEIKTMGNAGKRYDEVVTAALLLLVHYFDLEGKCIVHTRADYESWQPGRALVERATGMALDMRIDDNRYVMLT